MASVGTQAWRAPEVVHTSASSMLRTAKSDCFSMGLVFFFVLSKGTHPYSKSPTDISATIEANINNPKFVIKKLASPIQQHLVAGLLRHDPSERLTSAQVVNHPLFMTNSDKLGFLKVVFKKMRKKKVCFSDERKNQTCFDQFPELLRAGAPYAWIKKVPPSIASSSLRSSKLTSPYAETLYDACRFVRNLHEHAVNDKDEVARELQKLLKIPNTPTRSQLAIFVTKTFPELAAFAFDAVKSAVEGKVRANGA
jgi:serine/threonine protein kinase